MASETTGQKDQPYFSASGAPEIDVDPGQVSDYAALVGNHKVGLGSLRTSLTGKKVWDGLHFTETDTDMTYQYIDPTGWVLLYGYPNASARVMKNAGQSSSPSSSTNTRVTWDVETYDNRGMHSNTSNNSRITVPAGWAGYYSAKSSLRFSTTSANCIIQLAVNGTIRGETARQVVGSTGTSSSATVDTSDEFFLNAGDYVEVFMLVGSSSVPLITDNCSFSLTFLHA